MSNINVLRQFKEENHLNFNQMSKATGIKSATIRRHIAGTVRPSSKFIKKYTEVFGLQPYDLFSIGNKSWPADLMGQKFGKLTVIDYGGSEGERRGSCIVWLCECECGNITKVRSSHLTIGHTLSCGCLGLTKLIAGGENKLENGLAAANVLLYNYKKSARQRGYSWQLKPSEFLKLTSSNCFYCGLEPQQKAKGNGKGNVNGVYLHNGIDRVDNSLGYIPGNVRPCCKQCNIAKGSLTEEEFSGWLQRIYLHLKESTRHE